MGFSPVNASKSITNKYKRYLSTIFEIDDKDYAKQFEKELNNEYIISKGPYLDVTDAFVKGSSIEELINKEILSKKFEKINMPKERPLYMHQEEAILKINKRNNIVVSTGTGSGKTECFLIPIFNSLLREHENKRLTPGVRTLIIYPMNALANDQIERLRGLLSDYPEITYGSYTGQTKHKYTDALMEYKKLNNDEMPLKNELISREQMKKTPPHILITNYAMLEYLMIRPDDNVFFDGEFSFDWEYIVLDEAHVYNGSTGIEVSMLLRRLKAKLPNGNLKYILTSATLGNEEDNDEVAEFAANLCDSVFNKDDVVRAVRMKPEPEHELATYPIGFYNDIAILINNNEQENKIIDTIHKKINRICAGPLNEVLYEMVLHDNNYWETRKYLSTPKPVSKIAAHMNWTMEQIENFVIVASKGEKKGDKLFDARYHMFLKATDSVFITLKPNKKLFLSRKKKHFEGNEEYKVFEIATCSSCHCIYLIGRIKNGYLEQSSSINEDDYKSVFLLADNISDSDEDHLLENESIRVAEYEVCSKCGFIRRTGTINGNNCEHEESNYVKVFKIDIDNQTNTLTKCLSCENTNSFGILRMFFTGQEAATSVISTGLYEELPSYSIKEEIIKDDDDMGFGFAGENVLKTKTNIAKQFIAFSDNRQAAAFFSSYLDQTYRNILYKRIIIETIKENTYSTKGKVFSDFIEDLVYQFEKHNIGEKGTDTARKEAWKAALRELVDNRGNTSLFSMGLLGLSLNEENFRENPGYKLEANDVAAIFNIFALGMMSEAALNYDVNLTKANKEYFTHNGVEYSFTLSDSNPKAYKKSFIPTRNNLTNKRLDYFIRVLEKVGNHIIEERAREVLGKGIWKAFINMGLIKPEDGKYRIDVNKIRIINNKEWFICSKCKKVTIHNAFNVCPSFRCDGELYLIDIARTFKNNHYYRIYQELDIRKLRVVEHTAQLNRETAYEYQKKFKQKEIDILSCSTTFEMGVDVGTLETVFMRNMPPSPSNYAQRAGRAGRSKHSAAYAVTFSNRASHDFSFFNNPEKMIRGRINPPKFKVENEKIAIRHLYASALAFFWRKYPQFFSKASDMIESANDNKDGYSIFRNYLESYPSDLKIFIKKFLPESLSKKFGIENFLWIDGLMSNIEGKEGVFAKAVSEYEYEVGILKESIERAINDGRRVDNLRERLRVYKNEDILSFLSRKNVLPKYGFPVDTVEMTIIDKSSNSKLGLQLQRDLAMAISEYAPDSQIVANGNLITSRYIRKIPNMNWKQFDYIYCNNCKTLNIEQHVIETEYSNLTICRQCKEALDAGIRKVFLIPLFGFEADGEGIKKPGLKKPERTYRSEVSYVGYKSDLEKFNYKIGNAMLEIDISQSDEMAVLNESNFFICEYCGYALLDEKAYNRSKIKKHKRSSGYWCGNDGSNKLKRFSLGYRFETDVVKLKFLNPDLADWEVGLSVLYGILRGISAHLNIEQNDISGCLQYFYNTITNRQNFELILYDKTPGGAGHVRRLNNERILEGVLKESLSLMKSCDCGGKEMDSSCYTCLRGYYNQKHHDLLKRKYVIDFLNSVFA